jgi:hypothetical protein
MQPQEYVGIDLHRRRSVIVRRSSEGKTLELSHVNNDDLAFERAVTAAAEHPRLFLKRAMGGCATRRHHDRVGGRAPPAACRSRPLKLEAA